MILKCGDPPQRITFDVNEHLGDDPYQISSSHLWCTTKSAMHETDALAMVKGGFLQIDAKW